MIALPLPTYPGGWACVLADPPWSFRDKGSRIAPDERRKRVRRLGYRTMDVEAIASLPVREIAAPNAFLFLWATSAHLLDGSAAEVAIRWGFVPKATISWVKVGKTGRLQIGMGHYVRNAHEHLLVCRRGSARVLVHDVPSVIFGSRTVHSAKPAAAHEAIERLCDGPRLELFARAARAGWTTWGDQAVHEAPRLAEAAGG